MTLEELEGSLASPIVATPPALLRPGVGHAARGGSSARGRNLLHRSSASGSFVSSRYVYFQHVVGLEEFRDVACVRACVLCGCLAYCLYKVFFVCAWRLSAVGAAALLPCRIDAAGVVHIARLVIRPERSFRDSFLQKLARSLSDDLTRPSIPPQFPLFQTHNHHDRSLPFPDQIDLHHRGHDVQQPHGG